MCRCLPIETKTVLNSTINLYACQYGLMVAKPTAIHTVLNDMKAVQWYTYPHRGPLCTFAFYSIERFDGVLCDVFVIAGVLISFCFLACFAFIRHHWNANNSVWPFAFATIRSRCALFVYKLQPRKCELCICSVLGGNKDNLTVHNLGIIVVGNCWQVNVYSNHFSCSFLSYFAWSLIDVF